MAFERKTWCSFTEEGIKKYVSSGSGVYGIYGPNGLLYVGESNNMERRLLEHLNESGTCIKRGSPTDCTWEEVANNQRRVARQDVLILALAPSCNKKLG
ncbi:MAG: GIY-YIG nuclease family protein [Bryobacteraceae bacterium]|jgi:predicted GIY-YIG superfamily endonuclease